jgi:hypothetical protein
MCRNIRAGKHGLRVKIMPFGLAIKIKSSRVDCSVSCNLHASKGRQIERSMKLMALNANQG